jgi:hypothetical protein
MLPPSDPRWTDVRPPGVSRPPRVPPDDVYPIGTDRTITPRRDRPLRTPKMAKVEVVRHPYLRDRLRPARRHAWIHRLTAEQLCLVAQLPMTTDGGLDLSMAWPAHLLHRLMYAIRPQHLRGPP